MNETEMAIVNAICNYATQEHQISELLQEEVGKLIAYQEARDVAYHDFKNGWKLFICSNTCEENQALGLKNLSGSAETSKGGAKEMSMQFTDGSFRTVRNSQLLQYRFMYQGKQVSVYGKTKQDCYEKRLNYHIGNAQFRQKPQKKPIKNTVREKYTYKKWLNKWYALYKEPGGYKTGYLKNIISYMRNYLEPAFGSKFLEDITPLSIQEFLVKLKSDNTRVKVAAILSESLRDATVAGLIARNPYEGVKFKRYEQPRLGALTHAEQIAFLEAIDAEGDEKIRIFARALLMTGMRQGELNALQVKNVDLINLQIKVEYTWDKHDKRLVKPKTKSGYRTFPIAQPLADLLKPALAECVSPDDRIFSYQDANYTPRFFSKLFKSCGINYTGHILRHTFITNAYEMNFPPYLIQHWVGHAKIEQADTYLALRKPSDFKETEITMYMRQLKEQTVLKM